MQPGVENSFGLTWLTTVGSLVYRNSILLIRLEILALAAMDDSIEWKHPFEEIELVFLDFSRVGSHWCVFLARSSNKSHPWFSSFCKIPRGTWFLREFFSGSLNCHRLIGIIVTSFCYDEDTG